MRFSVYGRYELEVVREAGAWVVYRSEDGKRRPAGDLIVPAHLNAEDVPTYLDDILHELARPGTEIRRLR